MFPWNFPEADWSITMMITDCYATGDISAYYEKEQARPAVLLLITWPNPAMQDASGDRLSGECGTSSIRTATQRVQQYVVVHVVFARYVLLEAPISACSARNVAAFPGSSAPKPGRRNISSPRCDAGSLAATGPLPLRKLRVGQHEVPEALQARLELGVIKPVGAGAHSQERRAGREGLLAAQCAGLSPAQPPMSLSCSWGLSLHLLCPRACSDLSTRVPGHDEASMKMAVSTRSVCAFAQAARRAQPSVHAGLLPWRVPSPCGARRTERSRPGRWRGSSRTSAARASA